MAVLAADLTSPTGELQPAWFGDLPGALAVWIPLGEAQAPAGATTEQADRVTTAYAYWRGFKDVLLRAAGDPNSISLDSGDLSLAFSKDQRDRFAAEALRWETELDAAKADVSAPPPPVVIDNAPRASFSQPIVRAF